MSTRSWSVVLVVLTTVAASAAGPDPKYKAPRTENGQPDLQGVWNLNTDVPLERPAAFADRKFFTREEMDQHGAAIRNGLRSLVQFAPVENVGLDWVDSKVYVDDLRTSLITYPENGRLPKLVDGVRRVPGVADILAVLAESKGGPPPALLSLISSFAGGTKDGYEDFGQADRCLFGANAPMTPSSDSDYVQILQSKDHVVLLTDAYRRLIPLDGTPRPGIKLRSWSGESRGHWEGDTLVVETSNFNRRTPSFSGAGNSLEKVVTERFRRGAKNVLEYKATIVDPKTFQDKIVLSFPMAKVDAHLYEWACHEGNYSLPNILAGARKEEEEALKAK